MRLVSQAFGSAFVFACLPVLLLSAMGQAPAAAPVNLEDSISQAGNVVDATGAAIAHATVEFSRSGRVAISSETDPLGAFLLRLQPGTYTLTVTAPGFETYTARLSLRSTSMPPITVRLEIAKQTENVDVEAESGATIAPTETQLGDALSQQQVAAVPLNGRSFTDLLALTPGVVPVSSAQPNAVVMSGVASTPPSGDLDIGALSVSGQRETANAFRVNGSNVQEDVNMGVAIVPTLDSVADLED